MKECDKWNCDEWGVPTANPAFSNPFNENVKKRNVWKYGKQLAICISHDVDMPFKGYNLPWSSFKKIQSYGHISVGYRAKLIYNLMKYKFKGTLHPKIKNENFCFDDWIAYEKSIGGRSCFYVSTVASWDNRGIDKDVKYEYTQPEIAHILPEIVEKGWEIGLHASIMAGRRYNSFLEEKQNLERIVKSKIYGMRQHFWSPGTPDIMHMIESAGFLYDSSLGLNDMIGYRCGMCSPFYPEGCSTLIEIPPTIMDAGVDKKNQKEAILAHFRQCYDYGGASVLDWHMEQWNPNNLNGIGQILVDAIDDIRSEYKSDIWFCSPIQLALWWLYGH